MKNFGNLDDDGGVEWLIDGKIGVWGVQGEMYDVPLLEGAGLDSA